MMQIIEANGGPAIVLDARTAFLLAPLHSLALAQMNKAGGERAYVDRNLLQAVTAIHSVAETYRTSFASAESASITPSVENAPDQRDSYIEQWMSTAEAAREFGRDVSTIRRWVRQGKLGARHEGHMLMILAGQQHPTSFEVAA